MPKHRAGLPPLPLSRRGQPNLNTPTQLREADQLMISAHLRIGALLFDSIDQIDLTGPFEVLSRLPDGSSRTGT
jgi:hypothetical protein